MSACSIHSCLTGKETMRGSSLRIETMFPLQRTLNPRLAAMPGNLCLASSAHPRPITHSPFLLTVPLVVMTRTSVFGYVHKFPVTSRMDALLDLRYQLCKAGISDLLPIWEKSVVVRIRFP